MKINNKFNNYKITSSKRSCLSKHITTKTNNLSNIKIKTKITPLGLRQNSSVKKSSNLSTSSKGVLSKRLKHHSIKNALSSNIPRKKSKWNSQCLIPGYPYTLSALLNHLCKPLGYNIDEAIREVISVHNNMIKNHGVESGTARFNSIRLYAILLIEGRKPEPLPRVALGKRDR